MAGSWWRRIFSGSGSGPLGPRTTGRPTSSNGASSFHLRWMVGGEFQSVSVVFEVLVPPSVPKLYFWAIQGDFADERGRRAGGAHLGLQWHPGHPGSTAVNWGGYDAKGSILNGSESALPSRLANPHTRDLAWRPVTRYRLTIEAVQSGSGVGGTAWRGSVTDLDTGVTTVVRDLFPSGDRIVSVVMWSEVFADCDDPSVEVRWSDAVATRFDGSTAVPAGFSVNYQTHEAGGCANTVSVPDGVGIVQRTSVPRTVQQGAVLRTD